MADVILLGAPGAGKGTQARLLCERFGYAQIATGDLLRAHRTQGSDLGKAAEGYMTRGELVPDDLIVQMVAGELSDGAAVLFDGFPRTIPQAQALDALLNARGRGLPRAVAFNIDRKQLEERLLGRWTNPRNGRVYHERFNPPQRPGIEDEDGEQLVQRDDDRPETVRKRLDVFEEQTVPLISFYDRLHRLVSIDATAPVADVEHQLIHALALEHAH